MAIIFKLTNAGRQALINAAQNGTLARTLVSVGVTATAFTPTDALTSIPSEIKRITTLSGDVVAKDTIHVTVRDDGNQTYTVRGLGLYLDNGILLGSYSQAAVILEKSVASIFLLSTDLRVLDGSIDISTLQFGETNFINPPATTDRQGVVELATPEETQAKIDEVRAVTPFGLGKALQDYARVTLSLTAGNGLVGGGDLGEGRTFTLGTPGTLNGSTTNAVTATSHTHAIADATTAVSGVSALATDAEAAAGAVATKALTPSNLKFVLGSYVLTSLTLTAGNGLTGGGTLAANRSVTLGTPGTLSGSTANAVQTESHTHAIAAATETVSGVSEVATQAETDSGADDARTVTPKKLAGFSRGGGIKVFVGAGTTNWPVPGILKSGSKLAKVTVTGGGASGGRGEVNLNQTGGGGGAGGTTIGYIDLTGVSTVSVSVGAGGIPSSASSVGGGTSSFGTYLSATGGSGAAGSAGSIGGAGGSGAGGLINLNGGYGGDGTILSLERGCGNGGASFWGGAGRSSSASENQYTAPGSGGGGSSVGTQWGNQGMPGIIVIEY